MEAARRMWPGEVGSPGQLAPNMQAGNAVYTAIEGSVRPRRRVLHGARTGACDWEGKGGADILRSDASAGSLRNQ